MPETVGRDQIVQAGSNAGFTLIEIMAVVLIMGLLMGLVGVSVFSQVDKAKVITTRAKISQLEKNRPTCD